MPATERTARTAETTRVTRVPGTLRDDADPNGERSRRGASPRAGPPRGQRPAGQPPAAPAAGRRKSARRTARAGPAPRRPARASSTAEARSTLVVVGEEPIARAVRASLEDLSVEIVSFESVDGLDPARVGHVLGVVWCCAGSERGYGRPMARLRQLWRQPLYVVVGDDVKAAVVRGLYRTGASGVFCWPREGLLLARYIAEMLSLRTVRGPAADGDQALARTVRTHLRQLPLAGRPLEVEVVDGHTVVRGSVRSLADRDEVERQAELVPGVTSLDLSEVTVLPPAVPDASIRAACRRLIGSQLETRTVSARVRAGCLRLAGTVPDRRDAQRLRDLAARIEGVRRIEVDLSVSRAAARRDRSAQRRLRALLDDLFGGPEVLLSYHGGIAVLEGSAATLREKRSMQRLLEQDASVDHVVNKLQVRR